MANNTSRQNIFLQAIRWGTMHPGAQAFFLLGDGEGVEFICSQCVLMKFPLCSHQFSLGSQHAPQAPNVFPPTWFQYLLTLSHIFCPKFYSCKYIRPKRRRLQHIHFWAVQSLIIYFCDGPIKGVHHKN